jgi:hypothetical protein
LLKNLIWGRKTKSGRFSLTEVKDLPFAPAAADWFHNCGSKKSENLKAASKVTLYCSQRPASSKMKHLLKRFI